MRKSSVAPAPVSCLDCQVRDCSVLRNCTTECLELISEIKKAVMFQAGQRILMEGSHARGIYFIESGQVKIYKTNLKGQEVLLRFAKPGGVIGFCASENNHEYEVSAMAMTDTSLCFLDYPSFMQLAAKYPDLSLQLLLFFKRELCEMEQKSLKLSLMNVSQKVADAILTMETAYGSQGEKKPLNLVLSRQDIAGLAGTTKEQVSKVISDFRAQKIISTHGKHISILQRNRLQEMARV